MADRKCKYLNLEIRELVLVKLQPYIQTSIAQQSFSKLNRKCYGPYKVLTRIGPITYKVKLPIEAQIHPIFHISLLKQYHQYNTLHLGTLPNTFTVGQSLVTPSKINKKRRILQDDHYITKLLIQWPKDASSIMSSNLQWAYPSFNLGDKFGLHEGGNDTHTYITPIHNKKSLRESKKIKKQPQ